MSNPGYRALFLAVLALLFTWVDPSIALDSVSDQLSKVKKQAEEQLVELEETKRRSAELSSAINRTNKELVKLVEERRVLEKRVDKISQEIKSLQLTEDRLIREIRDAKGNIRRRAVAMYKLHRRSTAVDYLVNSGSATDLIRRANYLSRVASHDEQRRRHLAELVVQLRADHQKVEETRRVREEELVRLTVVEKRLGEKRNEQATLAVSVKEQESVQQKKLDRLLHAVGELEKVLAGIMGGREPTESATDVRKKVVESRYAGLAGLKGKLPLPTQSPVVRFFGQHKHGEFSDMLFSKGLEFRVPNGAEVTAVARGRVVLEQNLPGYGKVMILDHGARFYSLYGRIAQPLKKLGESVGVGEGVASVGDPAGADSNFYFELRVEGKATDPVKYFTKPPRSAAKRGRV